MLLRRRITLFHHGFWIGLAFLLALNPIISVLHNSKHLRLEIIVIVLPPHLSVADGKILPYSAFHMMLLVSGVG